MAASTTPIYLAGAFAAAPASLPVSFSTPNSDLTGATSTGMTTVVQGGTNGSIVGSVVFTVISNTGPGGFINLFYNDAGTRKLIGQVEIPASIDPTKPGIACPQLVWTNPNGDYFLASGKKIDAVLMQASCTVIAYATGGDY